MAEIWLDSYLDQSGEAFKNLEIKLFSFGDVAKSTLGKISGGFKKLADDGKKMGDILGDSIKKVNWAGVAADVFEMGTAMEKTRLSYKTLTGDVHIANGAIADMQNLSKQTGYGSDTMLKIGQQMLQAGVGANDLKMRMTQLNDVSLGNVDTFKAISGAYADIAGKGKAGIEELTALESAGVPVFDELQKMTGRSKEELEKLGGVSLDQVNQMFDNLTGTSGQFFGVTQQQSEQTGVKWAALVERFTELGQKIFTTLQPVIDKVLVLADMCFPALEGALDIALGLFTNVFNFLGENEWLLYAITGAVMGLAAAITATGVATALMSLAFSISPLGWVAIAIGAIAGIVAYCAQRFKTFRGIVFGLWEVFKQVLSNIGILFKTIFGPIIETIEHITKGEWEAAAESALHGVLNLNPIAISAMTVQWALDGDASKGVSEAFLKGQKDGLESYAEDSAELPKVPELKRMKYDAPFASDDNTTTGVGISNAPAGAAAKSLGDTGKSISVHIETLVKNIEIHGAGFQQNLSDLKTQITQVLIDAINDAAPIH